MKSEFLLFDFDGVLVDSMEIWAGMHMQTLRDANIPIPDNFVETITPLGNYHGARYTLSLGLDIPLDQYLSEINKKLFNAYTTHIHLKEYVKEALSVLHQEHISLNVLTASPHLYVDPCLQRNDIYNLFDHVWTIDDFNLTKAQPEIYRKAAERLGSDVGQCIMFDDNFTAISTAKKAGIRTVAVYDSTSKMTEQALKETADRYIYSFKELYTK